MGVALFSVYDHSVWFRHLVPPHHCFCPEKHGDFHSIGIRRLGKRRIFMAYAVCRTAGPSPFNPYISCKACQHNASSGNLFPIGMTLRAISLNQRPRFCRAVAHSQAMDLLRTDSGDFFCPLGSLGNPVYFSCQIRQVAFWRCNSLWHMFFIKANTVFVHKFLIL